MKSLMIVGTALAIAACAPLPNTSRTLYTSPMFDQFAIGGQDYPIVIQGAESVGLTPDTLAGSLKFPTRLPARPSSFRSVQHTPGLIDHAHLDVTTQGETATAILSFRHGEKRIAEGSFTLRREEFKKPATVGKFSIITISTLLSEAEEELRDSDNNIWIPN